MKRVLVAALLLLAPAASALGQSVKMPAEVQVQPGRLASVQIQYDGDDFAYDVIGDGIDAFREYDPDPHVVRLRLIVYQPGVCHVYAAASKAADKGSKVATARCKVVVGEPVPPGPGPGPGPNPPVPPVPGGLRVLVTYETADLGTMPRAQAAVLTNGAVRDYLNSKCATGPDGKTKEWRIWDKDVNPAAESKVWQDLTARKKDKLPWITITTDKGGFEGPLPGTVEETLALLKKYGG
jgi:hypothetical protein